MNRVILLADDLTGAADSAAPFASYGRSARLLLHPGDQPPDRDVLALSTNSREQDPQSARAAIDKACRWIESAGLSDAILFKKIDSTLRGQIAVELEAVVARFGIERMLVSPAFPSQGRTTLNGRHHVHGIPLRQTTFAGEGEPDDLIDRFGAMTGLPARHIPIDLLRGSQPLMPHLEEPGLYIPDIQSDVDMLRFVSSGIRAGINHFCGAGGLSWALAKTIGREHGQTVNVTRSGPALVVAGSLNQATIDQVDAAKDAGTCVVGLAGRDTDRVEEVAARLRHGEDVIVSSRDDQRPSYSPAEVRRLLGGSVLSVLQQVSPGVLVMTGGDVAAALCQELQVTAIDLQDEVEPGIPIGGLESSLFPGLTVITKAGGFGDRNTFVRLLASLRRA